jgi:hypothetical protein
VVEKASARQCLDLVGTCDSGDGGGQGVYPPPPYAHPLLPKAIAFVPYGLILIQVQVPYNL